MVHTDWCWRKDRIHPLEIFQVLNFLASHNAKLAIHVRWKNLQEVSFLVLRKERMTKSDRPLSLGNWGSTAMVFKPATDKQDNPWVKMVHTILKGQWRVSHTTAISILWSKLGRTWRREVIELVALIPQSHQSIYCKAPRVPESGNKSAQFAYEPGCQKIYVWYPPFQAGGLKHLQVEFILLYVNANDLGSPPSNFPCIGCGQFIEPKCAVLSKG